MSPYVRVAALLALALPLGVHAADPVRGKRLHDDNCIRCHASMQGGDGTGIYTRENRRIGSLDALRKQVNRCKNSLDVGWPKDDVDDVVAYLNEHFYQFDE